VPSTNCNVIYWNVKRPINWIQFVACRIIKTRSIRQCSCVTAWPKCAMCPNMLRKSENAQNLLGKLTTLPRRLVSWIWDIATPILHSPRRLWRLGHQCIWHLELGLPTFHCTRHCVLLIFSLYFYWSNFSPHKCTSCRTNFYQFLPYGKPKHLVVVYWSDLFPIAERTLSLQPLLIAKSRNGPTCKLTFIRRLGILKMEWHIAIPISKGSSAITCLHRVKNWRI